MSICGSEYTEPSAVQDSPSEPNLPKQLHQRLHQVLDGIALQKEDKTEITQIAKKLEEVLLKNMGEIDSLFEKMYTGKEITGSVKKKLKVDKPNEFDVNVLLALPLKENSPGPKLNDDRDYPSWMTCRFPVDSWQWPEPRKKQRRVWRTLFDTDGDEAVLRADGIRAWMQGLVARSIKRIISQGVCQGWSELKDSRSGPAITLKFKVDDEDVSIDLVPTISIPSNEPYEVGDIRLPDGHTVLLVPVPPRTPPGFKESVPTTLFRGTRPQAEKQLLEKKDSITSLVRLLKVVRNENAWSPISSFALYNLCANYCDDQKEFNVSDTNCFLEMDQLGTNLIKLLEYLADHLHNGVLPMTLDPNCNLFIKLTEEFRFNVKNRLKYLVRSMYLALESKDVEAMEKILHFLFPTKI